MIDPWETIAQSGFQFFGKMSASISHEIKNALAIINEKAGLLEDFTMLAGQGRPIDPERLKSLAGDIMKQIQRADGLVKRMNRFAHSSDDPMKTIDLGETLELITAIAGRLASMHEARVDLVIPDPPVMVNTNPFLLENLIWSCLSFFLADKQKEIRMSADSGVGEVRIKISGGSTFTPEGIQAFPSTTEEALLKALKAEIRLEPQPGEVILTLPKTI
ncbi:MAG: sensor histidine kinase [Thermodesulfobacteriota bacterium]